MHQANTMKVPHRQPQMKRLNVSTASSSMMMTRWPMGGLVHRPFLGGLGKENGNVSPMMMTPPEADKGRSFGVAHGFMDDQMNFSKGATLTWMMRKKNGGRMHEPNRKSEVNMSSMADAQSFQGIDFQTNATVRTGSKPVPQRVCIMVEPSPFTYVCGYMNRYRNTIRFLTEAGCEVLVVAPGRGMALPGADTSAFVDQPEDYEGARVISAYSFSCPWYGPLPLSFGLSPRIYKEVKEFNPDVIHCSSPGIMWLAALIYSRLLKKALVYSYHTHVPEYMPRYNITWLVPAMWAVIRFFHKAAHLTLATSGVLAEELAQFEAAPREAIDVWKKGVCSDTFHPRYECPDMRHRLTNGNPEAPLLLSVGRLGSEKNLEFLKGVLERNPEARLAFVGDGPARASLEQHFSGTNTVFTGILRGKELSAAYASADIFLMPSESETLGFVVLEAMASGVPVVAVRAGGIPDILTKDGVTGFLYDSEDIETASAQVANLIRDPNLRSQVGIAAREEVSLWDWRAATQHLLGVQYPAAMAAAAMYYGKITEKMVFEGQIPPNTVLTAGA